MFLKEYEKIEIILNKLDKRWVNRIGNYEVNKPILVDWKLLKYSNFRYLTINVKCDDCGDLIKKTIRILDEKNNLHYCKKCYYKGERCYAYGKPMHENAKKAQAKWRSENDSIFRNPIVREKIKLKNPWEKIHKKTRGLKRSNITREKIRIGVINSYKTGKRTPNSGWSKIKTKIYNGIEYQSSYELDFIKYFESIGLFNILERGPVILYVDSVGKEHTYYPDFRINNTDIVFEIKSSYLWKKNLEVNELKKEAANKIYNYILIIDKDYSKIVSILNEYKII